MDSGYAEMGWSKPPGYFQSLIDAQETGRISAWVASADDAYVGHVKLVWPVDPSETSSPVSGPEIQDLAVIPSRRRRGVAALLLDAAETAGFERSSIVRIGVGLHPGYGAAQRLYVRRGYMPDGRGVTYEERVVGEGETVRLDDDLVLHLFKRREDGESDVAPATAPARDSVREPWLRGPIPGIPSLLQPVAHALTMSVEDIAGVCDGLTEAQMWSRPGGIASVGFHLAHLAGSTDRLLTYARGESLSEEQMAVLEWERRVDIERPAGHTLVTGWSRVVAATLEALEAFDEGTAFEAREVGRARLPSTVLGLLFHVAEHASRHTGQVTTTAKIVRHSGSRAPR